MRDDGGEGGFVMYGMVILMEVVVEIVLDYGHGD